MPHRSGLGLQTTRQRSYSNTKTTRTKSKTSLINSPNFRLSVALSLVLLLHRLLYRFFVRLRANLRTDDATPFRARNPRISKVLTSRFSPAVGASAAGFALGISPQSQLRMTVAIYMATRSLEFLYNVLDQKGYCGNRPWWFGSWLLMPVSCAQLFHGFLFDRETTPQVCFVWLVVVGCANQIFNSGLGRSFLDSPRDTCRIGPTGFLTSYTGLGRKRSWIRWRILRA